MARIQSQGGGRDVLTAMRRASPDLDALSETEMEQDGKRFVVRSAPRPAASLALRASGVALPPTVRHIDPR
jgi:hypothetical protein